MFQYIVLFLMEFLSCFKSCLCTIVCNYYMFSNLLIFLIFPFLHYLIFINIPLYFNSVYQFKTNVDIILFKSRSCFNSCWCTVVSHFYIIWYLLIFLYTLTVFTHLKPMLILFYLNPVHVLTHVGVQLFPISTLFDIY